jgi:hypothetical protein
MENRRGPGQDVQPQARPAGGVVSRPVSSPAGPAPPGQTSDARPVKQDEKPSSRQLAPGKLSAPLPSRQSVRPSSAIEKKGGTQFLRKNGSDQSPAARDTSERASGSVPASPARRLPSRSTRLTGSSSRIAAAQVQQNDKPETSTMAFKLKFAMLASIPVLGIAVALLWFFGPGGGVVEDTVWKEIAESFNKLQVEIEDIRRDDQNKRAEKFGAAVERLQAILRRAEEHCQKKKSEGSEVSLKNMDDFIAKVKKTVEWMSKYREWGDMRVTVNDLFGTYKLAVSEKGLDQKKTALEAVLEKYKGLEKDVTNYKDEIQKKYEINPWFVQEVLDTIGINLRDIEAAIEKVKKDIENAKQAGQAGGGNNGLAPPTRRPPDKRDPLKPEEDQLVTEAKRAVDKAKSLFEDGMRERDQQKRNAILREASRELLPAYKTYQSLWATYKDKGEGYAFLEYEMDEVRRLDQQFKDKIKTH